MSERRLPLPPPRFPHLLDVAYAVGLGLCAPYWLLARRARGRVRSAFARRFARNLAEPVDTEPGPTVLLHAVSLGEINATRTLVAALLEAPGTPEIRVVVSATTQSGYDRAAELYGQTPRVRVARYPLDFSGPVRRFLNHYRPDVVVLMELELWPNFLRHCKSAHIPVLLVNGRLTKHSLKRYKVVGPLARWMFRSLAAVCVQDETYRRRFIEAGARETDVFVTGSMKFDTAQLSVEPERVAELTTAVCLAPSAQVLLAASTGPGEEVILLEAYRAIFESFTDLRLVIVPRKPERFDEVARSIRAQGFGLRRRSNPAEYTRGGAGMPEVVLGDTLGELRVFAAAATIVFVGRSLVDLGPKQHGSDMLEPAALGKPILVGPFTGNFADAMTLLRKHNAVIEIATTADLTREVAGLLTEPVRAEQMGRRGADAIRGGRGATARHARKVLILLSRPL